MRPRLQAVILGLLVGCGVRSAPAAEVAEPEDDPALDLAGMLPAGAERCAVSRPGALSPLRRALLQPLSRGGPAAWLSGVPVSAHAWAEGAEADGGRPAVALLRVHGDEAEVRRRVEAELRVRLTWNDDACRGPDCAAFRARFVDAHTLRLERGEWPGGLPEGLTSRCTELAARHPEALEVAARRGEALAPALTDLVPRRLESILRPVQGGVELVRSRWMATHEWADRARRLELLQEAPAGAAELATERWTERRGRRVTSTYRFHYEDLALAAEDARRLRNARAATERRRFLLPPERVDVRNLREVRRQVALRRSAMERAGSAGRADHARALAELLERATAVHPEVVELHRRLVRLLLDELGGAERALEIAESMLQRRPEQAEEWRLLRREALARESEPLAAALREDGVVPDASAARRAAADLVRLRRQGVDYPWAEGAMRVARAFDSGPAPAARPLDRPVRLPLGSVVPSLAVLLDGGGPSGRAEGVFFALTGDAVGPGMPPEPACLPFRRARGGVMCVGAVQEAVDARALALGTALRGRTGAGDVSWRVARVGRRDVGPGIERQLVVTGRIDGDGLLVKAASGSARAVPWERVRRYLAEPLSRLEPRLFPPPELRIEAESGAHADALLRRASEREDVVCRADGRSVRCQVPVPDSPGAAARALLQLVRPLLRDTGP
ncbi:MAG: hypothetical protein ACODAU_04575 [Myxococcota bacterium]